MKDIPLYTEFNGRRIIAGNLKPNGIFYKSVTRRHKLQVMDAYGLDQDYMLDAYSLGCKFIQLKEKDTGAVYRIDVDKFKKHAVLRSIGRFKSRLYCSLKYWERIDAAKPPGQAQTALN